MADEKNITYIGFQQGVNFGDNITLPPGSTYRSGGLSAAMERKKYYDQMKKEAAEAGMSLKDYMAKVKREMDEMEAMMNSTNNESSDVPDAEYVEIVEVKENADESHVVASEVNTDDDEKRTELERTNTLFKRVINEQKVDLLAIYNHIKEHFVEKHLRNQHHWAAVYIYFKKFLEMTEYTDFSSQMMNDSWFGEFKNDRNKACKNEALGTYTACILEPNVNKWSKNMPNADRSMSDRGISSIRSALIDLQVEGESLSFLIKQNK